MTNRWLTGAAAAALTVAGAFAAQAADLPTKKAPPAPIYVPPPFTWTGFYIGANAGGIWSTGNTHSTLYSNGFPILSSSFNGNFGGDQSGFIGGGQAGYNWQTGAFVLGVETDFDGSSLSKSKTLIGPAFSGLVGDQAILNGDYLYAHGKASLDWLGSTRARIGYVVTPDNRLMIYGTGGVAYGSGTGNIAVYDAFNNIAFYNNQNKTRTGYAVGGGAEYAITNNITIRAEYLYFDLGSSNESASPLLLNPNATRFFGNNTFATAKFNYQGSVARAGINYKF